MSKTMAIFYGLLMVAVVALTVSAALGHEVDGKLVGLVFGAALGSLAVCGLFRLRRLFIGPPVDS